MLPTVFLGLALLDKPVCAAPKADPVQDPLLVQLQEEGRAGIASSGQIIATCHIQRAYILAGCRGRPSPAEQALLDSLTASIVKSHESITKTQETLDRLDKLLTEQQKPTPHPPKTGPKK